MKSDHSLSSDEDETLVRQRDVKRVQRKLELEGYREGRARAQEAAIKVGSTYGTGRPPSGVNWRVLILAIVVLLSLW